MNIISDRILLRAIEASDLELIHKWSNDPDIASQLGNIHLPTSTNQQKQWFENIQSEKDTVRLSIQLIKDGSLIGYIGLWHINWLDRIAEFGFMIGDKTNHNKGFGTEATRALLKYSFETLDLMRIYSFVLETNLASLRAHEKSGFKVEGLAREHAFRNGKRVNVSFLGVLREDFYSKK